MSSDSIPSTMPPRSSNQDEIDSNEKEEVGVDTMKMKKMYRVVLQKKSVMRYVLMKMERRKLKILKIELSNRRRE
ncbi:hypothetical protein RHGRI_007407 [Rhododendron griersonianum]|uniref:Uncharacterized protein n=1 Tax=Rhododendron griersonianum TaxID=479676 RepID=A0AAV6KYD9_9ERIC|nr:hypothetical protein RHGRI_007407 [Rhododendron griersonianum]